MNADWFYRTGDVNVGPLPLAELRRLLAQGVIGPAAAVWHDGMPGWLPAAQVPALAPPEDGIQFLVPTERTSRSSMAAGYLGIFGIFFPPLGLAALVLGIVGVRDLKRNPQKNGWGRAITGIVLGALLTLGMLGLLVLIVLKG